MNFRLLYLFTFTLATLLTFGCGDGSEPDAEPDAKPELTILVNPRAKALSPEVFL